MSINFIRACKTTFSLSTPACPSCGKVPTRVKVRLRTPTGWRTLVTTDMNAAQALEAQLKQASKERRRSKSESKSGLKLDKKPDSVPTLGEVFEFYINEISDSKRSYRSDLSRWSLYLEKKLGPFQMNSVTPQLVLRTLNEMKPDAKY